MISFKTQGPRMLGNVLDPLFQEKLTGTLSDLSIHDPLRGICEEYLFEHQRECETFELSAVIK